MVLSTDADNVKMLLDILFPMNYVTTDQLALNLVDIFPFITLIKFCMFNFKTAYLAQLSADFNNVDLKI